jgi:dephospho-CoA kinase
MLKVGITGGIGSGKTTVCKIFETLGIPVYYADERAKWLMTHSSEVRQAIIQLFGPKAYEGDQLNRPYIAGIVFNDPEKLKQLNAIVHPAVKKMGKPGMNSKKMCLTPSKRLPSFSKAAVLKTSIRSSPYLHPRSCESNGS